jgi:hypothetical protein
MPRSALPRLKARPVASARHPEIKVADEGDLCRIWAAHALPAEALLTTAGRRIQVIYPGRRNGGAGPDFQGALIADAAGHVQLGDVEVHLHARDWVSHGHRADPGYNGVILHVVLYDDGAACLRADGKPVAVLALAPCIGATLTEAAAGPPPPGPCSVSPSLLTEEVRQIVRACGQSRLADKADAFEAHISVLGAEQALFTGLLDAAGYSRNRRACAALAERLPVERLQSLLLGKPPERAAALATAVVLGLAGLLPPERDDNLRELWAGYADRWPLPPLRRDAWVSGGVRPSNQPALRLQGIARLVARTASTGLAAALLEPLRQGDAPGLVRALEVRAAGSGDGPAGSAPIGPARAAEMAINVVVPFALALATIDDDAALTAAAWQTAGALPSGDDAQPLRHMATLLAASGHRLRSSGALDTQGLLHLYRTYCGFQACWECPLALGSGTSLTGST